MWHEARRHEKVVRSVMNDLKKRADRKREFFDSVRKDPASYLQIHGHRMKIHIDPAISQAAEQSLVPWLGDGDNLIDRFDVRAHLDHIPSTQDVPIGCEQEPELTKNQTCQLNYYRYRKLVQNDFLGINEHKCLQQIDQIENSDLHNSSRLHQQQQQSKAEQNKKKLPGKAIGYVYEDSEIKRKESDTSSDEDGDDDMEEQEGETLKHHDDSLSYEQLSPDMIIKLNNISLGYGMSNSAYTKFLQADHIEMERVKVVKEMESEKSRFIGKKGKQERKLLKQQNTLVLRSINLESEIDHFSVAENKKNKNKYDPSSEESADEDDQQTMQEGKIEFITAFGKSSSDEEMSAAQLAAKLTKKKEKKKIKSKEDDITTRTIDSAQLPAPEPAPVYGPMLPKEMLVKFNSSKTRSRRYRGNDDDSSDDDNEDGSRKRFCKGLHGRQLSPPARYAISNRRSPSVRRSSSSSSSSGSYSRTRKTSPEVHRHRHGHRSSSRRSRSRSIEHAYQRRRRSRSVERGHRRRSHSRSTRDRHSPSRERRSRDSHQRRSPKSQKSSRDRRRSSSKRSRSKSVDKHRNQSIEPKQNGKTSPAKVKEEDSAIAKPIKRYYRHDLDSNRDDLSDLEDTHTRYCLLHWCYS